MLGERLRPYDIYLSMPATASLALPPIASNSPGSDPSEARLVIGAELRDLPLTFFFARRPLAAHA